MTTYTVLGANGNIAQEVSKSLSPDCLYQGNFSRNPKKVNKLMYLFQGISWMQKRSPLQLLAAMWVFLLAGIQYSTKIWKRDWPIIMRNTLRCMCHSQKPNWSFSTNMYAFDPTEVGHLTEGSKMAPLSEKGKSEKTNSGYAFGRKSKLQSHCTSRSCCRFLWSWCFE